MDEPAHKDFIFGLRPVLEALDAGKEINKILLDKSANSELAQELKARLRNDNIPHQYVPYQKLDKVTRKNHQGVIAFLSPVRYQSLDYIISSLYEEGKTPLILLLDRITDVRNFGAICRTAECMGVHAVVLPQKGGALINADAVKTSAGAIHNIPVCRASSLTEATAYLQNSGLNVVGCSEKGSNVVASADLTGPTAIIMGSEEDGISTELLDNCNTVVKIPMAGNTASLNVSVAAGMILYEVVRQRSS